MDPLQSADLLRSTFNVTDISLGNWNAETCCQCISSILNVDSQDCYDLADVVCKKTHGNPTSVLKFLDFLQQDGLLYYSMNTYKWEWDAENINTNTSVTNDVGELLAARIKLLPKEPLAVLKLSACIGTTFHVSLLEQIAISENILKDSLNPDCLTEEKIATEYSKRLGEILNESRDTGLVETDGKSIFWFTHDLVQQTLYSNFSDDLSRLHLQVARVLDSADSETFFGSDARDLFFKVNHYDLGRSEITTDEERVKVIGLNVLASIKSKEMYSFRAAAVFLERAILMLKSDDWSTNYELTLEVYTTAAETFFSVGEHVQSMEYAMEIISKAQCTEGRLRGYFVKIDVLATERCFSQAILESCRVLEILGCKIPRWWKRYYLLRDLSKIKSIVTGKSLEDFLAMKRISDPLTLSTLRVMDTMTHLFAMKGDDAMAGLLLTRMMRTTLKYGHSIHSPYSFASYGTLLTHLGQADRGYYYGELSLKLAESFQSKRALASTAFIVFTFLNWTQKPLSDGIEPMLNAHRMALQEGDLETSSMCL
jgi:predicted ATPase